MLDGMKAAIFDMDGTLLDSMSEWRKLNCSFVREQGIELTPEQEKDLLEKLIAAGKAPWMKWTD